MGPVKVREACGGESESLRGPGGVLGRAPDPSGSPEGSVGRASPERGPLLASVWGATMLCAGSETEAVRAEARVPVTEGGAEGRLGGSVRLPIAMAAS